MKRDAPNEIPIFQFLSLFNNAQKKLLIVWGILRHQNALFLRIGYFQIQDQPVLVVVGSSLSSNDRGNSLIPDFKLSPLSSFLVPNPIKFVGPGFVTHRANWLILSIDTFTLSLSRIQLVIGKE